jgi:Gpi18-like mannosyltransferase
LIWLSWLVIMLVFQVLVDARFQPFRPDSALSWTVHETTRTSQNNKPYLIEPFMNQHVAWDSEFYLSIATVGYDDPDVRSVETPEGEFSKNYAFFPLYPAVMRIVREPLRLLALDPIATSTLAGVLVSLVSTLFALFALYDLTRDQLGEEGGIRTAFYFLIFPSSLFLAQVYTEALFAALAFGCLAFVHHRRIFWAGLLAGLATWTRAIGVFLMIPLGVAWLQTLDLKFPDRRTVLHGLPVLFPIAAYVIWRHFLGYQFSLVEDSWFGRGLFNFKSFWDGTKQAWQDVTSGGVLARRVYFLLEISSVLLALVACLLTLRSYPGVAVFGVVALVISLTSGAPQSLIRYMLVIPSLFIFLSRLGRNAAFDRAWTLGSVLLLSMQTALFTFDMWVA